jgi:hypothetical protein
MLAALLILLFTSSHIDALDCIEGCSITDLPFTQTFVVPDGKCKEPVSTPTCGFNLQMSYGNQRYNVLLGSTSQLTSVYIQGANSLTYTISDQCSGSSGCVVSNVQQAVTEYAKRNYDPKIIYPELGPYFVEPQRVGPLQCYDGMNNTVACTSDEMCELNYDVLAKKMLPGGCKRGDSAEVLFYNTTGFQFLNFQCNRSLCNGNRTLTSIRNVLIKNQLFNGVLEIDPITEPNLAGKKVFSVALMAVISLFLIFVL